jgi:hypothetical protein
MERQGAAAGLLVESTFPGGSATMDLYPPATMKTISTINANRNGTTTTTASVIQSGRMFAPDR